VSKSLLAAVLFACAVAANGDVRAQLRTAAVDAGASTDPDVRTLLTAIEQTINTGDADAYFALHAGGFDRDRARSFASGEILPGVTRAVIRERDREQLAGTIAGSGYRLMVDVFAEFGPRARAATWRLDIRRVGEPGDARVWAIVEEESLSSVENLYRLGINVTKQFAAHNLKIAGEDIDLTLAEGSVFQADTDQGATALVLIGNGAVNFHPSPDTEKGQVRIFCGTESLDARFDAAYLRVNPNDVTTLIDPAQLSAVPVDLRELRRAQDIFRDESTKSFQIDLGDLSRDPWSLLPGSGDFVAEIRTRRYDTLTYAKAGNEAEDISFFDRRRHHNIALYPSKQKLAMRGPFYNEDDQVDYDVLDYDIETAVSPDRLWIDGRTRMRVKIRSQLAGTLTFKLADTLAVQSIVSYEYGRLFGIRVKNQNMIVVNLPTLLARDSQITVTFVYAGRLEPQQPDRETVAFAQRGNPDDAPLMITAEPHFLYSNRSAWYPQAPVSDYATARIQITVPSNYDCVASGQLEPGFPGLLAGKDGGPDRKVYIYSAPQPVRYLSFILSRFSRAETATIAFGEAKPETVVNGVALSGLAYRTLSVSIETNPRQIQRGR
jgi:hypothetical protein